MKGARQRTRLPSTQPRSATPLRSGLSVAPVIEALASVGMPPAHFGLTAGPPLWPEALTPPG